MILMPFDMPPVAVRRNGVQRVALVSISQSGDGRQKLPRIRRGVEQGGTSASELLKLDGSGECRRSGAAVRQ